MMAVRGAVEMVVEGQVGGWDAARVVAAAIARNLKAAAVKTAATKSGPRRAGHQVVVAAVAMVGWVN